MSPYTRSICLSFCAFFLSSLSSFSFLLSHFCDLEKTHGLTSKWLIVPVTKREKWPSGDIRTTGVTNFPTLLFIPSPEATKRQPRVVDLQASLYETKSFKLRRFVNGLPNCPCLAIWSPYFGCKWVTKHLHHRLWVPKADDKKRG